MSLQEKWELEDPMGYFLKVVIYATFFYKLLSRITHRTVTRYTKAGEWGGHILHHRPCNKQVHQHKAWEEHSLLWRKALQQKEGLKIFSSFTILSFHSPVLQLACNFTESHWVLSKTIDIIKKNLNFQQLIDCSTLVLFLVYINAKHLICSDAFPIIKHLISSGFSILHSDLE